MAFTATGQSGNFTITPAPSVTLDSPNSGTYAHNQNISISWSKSNFTENIDLYWTTGTTFATTNNILVNQSGSSFSWNVPSSLADTSIYIWVRKTSDSTVKDRSNSSISITGAVFTQTPADTANFSEDTPTSDTTVRWMFQEEPVDTANLSEDTPTSSTKIWKHIIPPDQANFSEDSLGAVIKLWRFIVPDTANLSEADLVSSQLQWIDVFVQATSQADLSEASLIELQELWKHLAGDQANFSEDTLGEEIKPWKYLIPSTANFSEDPVTSVIKLWKQIVSETVAITEEEPGDVYLSEPGDFSSFTEDFSSQVLKGLALHKFDPSGTESFGILRKSGWLKASDLNSNSIVRDISLRYNSEDPITVNIYADGDEVNPVFTKIAPSQTGEELFNKSFRVGRRAKYFMVELLTGATANYNTTIASLEVKVDG